LKSTVTKPCKDCAVDDSIKNKNRPAIYPGPRCTTHHRAEQRRIKNRAHERRIENGYSLTPEDYWALYKLQGGHCFICGVATGKTKRLAVDHDHTICSDHSPLLGCPRCIRGLLCGRCNQMIAIYGIESLCRAVYYLQHPPAREYFETRVA